MRSAFQVSYSRLAARFEEARPYQRPSFETVRGEPMARLVARMSGAPLASCRSQSWGRAATSGDTPHLAVGPRLRRAPPAHAGYAGFVQELQYPFGRFYAGRPTQQSCRLGFLDAVHASDIASARQLMASEKITGVISIVQENRFLLEDDAGGHRLFLLAHDARFTPEDLALA